MSVDFFRFGYGRRAVVLAALLASALLNIPATSAHAARRLLSTAEARQLGLQRAWFSQVALDRSRSRVERAVLHGDRLTIMTSAGVVQELNALTGETLWTAPIGDWRHPSLGPTSSDTAVALLNGSTLYVLDRTDGRPILIRSVGGAPGAAPALGESYAFVPLVTGRVEGYPIHEKKFTPWYYKSYGRAMVAPLTTEHSLVWATDSGHLYVADIKELGVRFRLEAGSEIVAPPSANPPYLYVATSSGEVFSIHEETGRRRWKYAAGYPVTRAPAVVGERVFVTSEEPMLHAIDATRGMGLWEAPGITQFAAASDDRVYGVDEFGALVVLNAATGSRLERMFTDAATHALVNDQTDWVYLVSEHGAVQCLHEIGDTEPTYHRPKPEPAQPAGEEQPATAPAPQQQPSAEEDVSPFEAAEAEDDETPAEEPQPAIDFEDPFGAFE